MISQKRLNARRRTSNGAWVAAVDMGYGHQRAAFALRSLAKEKKVLSVNDYKGMPREDRIIWKETRAVYEFVSRLKKLPVLGDFVFSLMDKVQEIKPFYPKTKPLESPGLELKVIWQLLEKRSWGRHFVKTLKKHPLPLVATFPVAGFMAEHWEYEEPIFLVVTDTDATRAWVPLNPKATKIRYCAPTERVAERLLQYGVPASQITLTGFPLPPELVDEKGMFKTKDDLRERLQRLDPKRKYISRYADVVRRYLGTVPPLANNPGPVTITFAVGGAGAQINLAKEILEGVTPLLRNRQARLVLVAATHRDAKDEFEQAAKEAGLQKEVEVLFAPKKEQYFEEFNNALRKTDILWTKPSELSFFAGLGIPILIAPPIGAQEEKNQEWLLGVGAGIKQKKPAHAAEWIQDYLDQGLFAEAAMQGFVEIEKQGAASIASLVNRA